MRKREHWGSLVTLALLMVFLAFVPATEARDASEAILSRWRQKQEFRDEESRLEVEATYYAAEYIEAVVHAEAQKNLWTQDEAEQFKYQLLSGLQLDEYIPVLIRFNNLGPTMHLAPFDSMLTLWVGKKKLAPADYDKRFNFRLQGEREGMIFFPRYDEKGRPNLQGVKTAKLSMSSAVSSVTMRRASIDFVWDVGKDNPEALTAGRAVERLELDRLIKRSAKLNEERKRLEGELEAVTTELSSIDARIEELQAK